MLLGRHSLPSGLRAIWRRSLISQARLDRFDKGREVVLHRRPNQHGIHEGVAVNEHMAQCDDPSSLRDEAEPVGVRFRELRQGLPDDAKLPLDRRPYEWRLSVPFDIEPL